MDPDTVATIIRMTGGTFRLLNRLLTQMERILEINALDHATKAVVEAARESLVIGQAEQRPGSRARPVRPGEVHRWGRTPHSAKECAPFISERHRNGAGGKSLNSTRHIAWGEDRGAIRGS
jgi:hypothetical protein